MGFFDSVSHALGTDGSSSGGGLLTTLVEAVAIYYTGGLAAEYLASTASIALADTAISGALIVNASYAAATVAELYAFSELNSTASPVAAAQAQGMLINTSSNVAALPVIYGYRRVGGTRVLTQVSGANNEYLHIIIALCEGEIDSVSNIYIDNVLSTDAKFTGLVTTYVHTGTDTQAADANLIADLPAIWTSAHTGSGIAYVYAKLKYDRTAFSGFPTITADVLGIKTYDPRTGATALGDVCLIAAIGNITDSTGATISTGVVQPTTAVSGQTWQQTYPAGYPVQTGVANPGSLAANQTWLQVRANPALCIRDYLTNVRYGRGISAAQIDDASIITAANYCDSMVTIPTGTQARYTCNGVINIDSTAFDNIKLLLASCRAMLVYSAGKYKLICDSAQSSAFSFNEDNITGAWSIATAGRTTRLNRVTAQFYDPASNWQPNYAISESTDYRSAQDNGLVLEAQVSLAFTANLYTAQQLAGLQLKQSRFGLVVSFKAFQVGLRCEVGDVVDITHSTTGWSGKLFRVTSINILDTEEVEIVATEYDSTVYGLDTLTAITSTPTLSLPSPFVIGAPTGLSITSENITQPDGTIIPRMVASWTAAADAFVTGYEIAWSENGGPWDTTISTGTRWVIPASVTGRSYDVRVRSVNAIGTHSAWLTVTGTVAAAPTVAPASPVLTAVGGMFSVRLTWSFGDARTDIRGVEVWYASTDDRSTASRLSLEAYPRQEYTHVGLAAGGGGYYWARTVDTFGNISAWYPASSTGGLYAVASSDPSAILTQLNNSLGLGQLVTSLATPISNMPFESAANLRNANNAANAALQSALSDFDLTSRMQWQESVTNATCTIDSITGKISLLATANVTTDVSAQLTAVQVLANATAATLTSTVSTLTTVSGNLTSTQAAVTILQGQITTTASTVYVDNSVANATGPITTTAANAYTSLAASELQSAIDAFTGQQSTQALTASVALANTNIKTTADALSAQVSSFAALVAAYAGSTASTLAAITTEQTTRAANDAANAATTTTLTATVASNLATTNTALATKATIAYVDAATATLTASIASTSATLTTNYTAAIATGYANAQAYVQSYSYSKSTVDSAIASSGSALTASYTAADTATLAAAATAATASITSYSYAKSTVDANIASAVSTLMASGPTGYAAVVSSASASATAITGLQANYTIQVSAGHAAGIAITGGATSSLVFLADKFAFVAPDGTGTPKNVMTVGTIGGISTFGFNGNIIVDGSIVAQSIAAGAITATQIATNTITADLIISASCTSFERGSDSLVNGTWFAHSFYMDHAGYANVIYQANFNTSTGGGSYSWDVRAGIDSTTYYEGFNGTFTGGSGPPGAGVQAAAYLGAGWHTLNLYAMHSGAVANHIGYSTILKSYR